MNLATRAFSQSLPFREAFQLTGDLPESVDSVFFRFGPTRLTATGDRVSVFRGTQPFRRSPVIKQKEFAFAVSPMEPNQPYLFRFILFTKTRDPNDTTKMIVVSDSVSTAATARTSIANHFDSDIGVAHSFEAGYWGIVTNSHLYAVPVNKNEDLSTLTPLARLARRVSLFAGLAVQELHSDNDVQEMFGVGSPVVGVGLRGFAGFDPIRVNGGVIFFKQEDANPLVTAEHTKRDTFVSVTADIEIQKLLGPLVALIK